VRADRPDRGSQCERFFVGDEFQSIYGFRHADVLVFRERPRLGGGRRAAADDELPLAPEVLARRQPPFRSDFGDEFQPLAASGDFP
jgi:hypothetical protein